MLICVMKYRLEAITLNIKQQRVFKKTEVIPTIIDESVSSANIV